MTTKQMGRNPAKDATRTTTLDHSAYRASFLGSMSIAREFGRGKLAATPTCYLLGGAK